MLQLPHWTWDAYLIAVCSTALWLGGKSERVGASILLTGWLATVIVMDPKWWEAAGAVIAVDLAMLVALVTLALRSNRYWPIATAGFHLLAILTHWARTVDPDLGTWAYATAGIIWGYLTIASLAVGTFGAWRRGRQPTRLDAIAAGPDPTRR